MQLLDEVVEQIRLSPKLVAVEDYEVCVATRAKKLTDFENGEPLGTTQDLSAWVSLRLIHRKQPGRAFVSSLNKESLNDLVNKCYLAAEQTQVDPWFRFPIWRNSSKEESATLVLPPEKNESDFHQLRSVPEVVEERFEDQNWSFGIFRKTERFTQTYQSTNRRCSYLIEKSGAYPLLFREELGARKLEDVVEFVDAYQSAREFNLGPIGDLIFNPRASSQLLSFIRPWFLASSIQEKNSPLAEIGDRFQAFPKCLNIVDNGSLAGAPNACPFDMEGVHREETVLVEKGWLKEFLYDSYHAAKENRLSTGNFVLKDFRRFAELGATNFFIKPSQNTVLPKVEKGILIEYFQSMECGPDFEISGVAWGRAIENGTPQQAYINIPIQLRLFDIVRSIAEVGDDLQFFGPLGSPSILLEKYPLSR